MLVETQYGLLEGTEKNGIAAFKGVPYAQAPVDALRWKAPMPVQRWNGTREAKEFGPASAQTIFSEEWIAAGPYGHEFFISSNDRISEDCLYLNVWSPAQAIREGEKLPVLFIIHGGAFRYNAGTVPVLWGHNMAEKGMVVVTLNYRLGVMGFFTHPELDSESDEHISGNYALMDQIAALTWVRDNIEAFGGDPSRVTISGESAGAFCVSCLCRSPKARGLFARAVAASGSFADRQTPMYRMLTLREAEQQVSSVCGNRSLCDLRNMTDQELLALTKAIGGSAFMPVLDDIYLPVDASAVARGCFNDVPILIGSNMDDGSQFTARTGRAEDFKAMLLKTVGADNAGRFLDAYSVADPERVVRSQIQYMSDGMFGHSMYTWARQQSLYGKQPVYLYNFNHVPPKSTFGAYHSSELYYFYHNLESRDLPWTAIDRKLEDILSGYITGFVREGNPNGEDCPVWESFQKDNTQIMLMDDAPHMAHNPLLKEMACWDAYLETKI